MNQRNSFFCPDILTRCPEEITACWHLFFWECYCQALPHATSQLKTRYPSQERNTSVFESPITKAAIQGDQAEIKALLDAGADINVKDALGEPRCTCPRSTDARQPAIFSSPMVRISMPKTGSA